MKTSNIQTSHNQAIVRGWITGQRASSGVTVSDASGGGVNPAVEIRFVGASVSGGEDVAIVTIGSGNGSGVGGGTVGGVGSFAGTPVTMLNNAGVELAAGSVVVVDETADRAVTTTTTVGDTRIAGVAQAVIPDGATGPVLFNGLSGGVITTDDVPRGYYLRTSATAAAAEGTVGRVSGSFAVVDTSAIFPATSFVRDVVTTESVGAVTSLAIDLPASTETNRVLFLALWRDPTITTAVTLTGWTRIGSTSGFWYYYRVTTGTDTATATWSTGSPAVAVVVLLSEIVDASDIVEAFAYDATTAAAAVSGMSAAARYAIAAVADDPATPALWDAIATGASSGTGPGGDLNLAHGTVTSSGNGVAADPPTPGNTNDGDAGTASVTTDGAVGGGTYPERWWIADLGASYDVIGFTVKFLLSANGLDDWLNAGSTTPTTNQYARFQYGSTITGPWTDLATTETADDGLTPETSSWEWPSSVTARYWRIFTAGKLSGGFFDGIGIYTWNIVGAVSLDALGTLVGQYIDVAAAVTSPYTGASAQSDAIFAFNLTDAALASCLLYGSDLLSAGIPITEPMVLEDGSIAVLENGSAAMGETYYI